MGGLAVGISKKGVGAIVKGQEIGKQPYVDYIFALCPYCGKPRPVELRLYRRKPDRPCAKCAAAIRTRRLVVFKKQEAQNLTPQQHKILVLISKGMPNKQIAFRMGLAKSTVDHHCDRIFKKLGVDNRVSAVVRGLHIARNVKEVAR